MYLQAVLHVLTLRCAVAAACLSLQDFSKRYADDPFDIIIDCLECECMRQLRSSSTGSCMHQRTAHDVG